MNKDKMADNDTISVVNDTLKHKVIPAAVLGGVSYLIYKAHKDRKKQQMVEKALGQNKNDTYESPFDY